MEEGKQNIVEEFLKGLRNIWPAQGSDADRELNASLLTDPLFLNFVNTSPVGIAIFSYETISYEYFSPNLLEMLGYTVEQLQGINGAEFTMNTFHPAHLVEVNKMMEVVKKYYYTYALEKRILDTRFSWTVQLKRPTGKYFWTLQQTVILEENAEGFPLRSLIFVSDITDIKTNTAVDFVFSLKDRDKNCFDTIYMAHYDPGCEYVLSEREIEILNCLGKGMSNQQIADKLKISKHTVMSHRKNILKKSGKDNIIQLLVE